MEFCRVTHTIKHTLPDLEGTITGKCRFTPQLGNGDSWSIKDEYTVPALGVTAELVDGVLSHDGNPWVDLFAAGPDAAPARVIYRVDYQPIMADGHQARIRTFLFEAVPGGEVNLAEMIPAAGEDMIEVPSKGSTVAYHKHVMVDISDLPPVSMQVDPDVIVQRQADGQIQVPVAPTSPAHAVSMDYADSKTTPDAVSTMISQAISGLVSSAPDALDTIYELAQYLTDPGVASGLVAQLAEKADKGHKHTRADITDLPELSEVPSPNELAQYSGRGTLRSASPTLSDDVAPKSYVDSRTPAIRTVTEAEYAALTPEPSTIYVVMDDE